MGIWLKTLHCAPQPHDPGHGSWHFSLIHASLLGHSECIMHSGLQFGGLPTYWDKHEHDGVPPWSWHVAYAPHGDGTHGLV